MVFALECNMKKGFLVFFMFCFLATYLFGQGAKKSVSTKEPLPTSFRSISLGMGLEQVKQELKADKVFGFRGERDFSLLPTLNRSNIETEGSYFISRAWFQFYEESLYTLSLKLNTDHVDYYSIYSHFVKKYGEPLDINPQRAIWENDTTRVTIERPLIVTYIDMEVFNAILDTSKTETATSEKNRQAFIEQF